MNTTSSQSEHHHRRRSCAEVAALVAEFEQSGLKRTEYCRQHGLSLTSLKRYAKRMGDEGRGWHAGDERTAPTVSLIPVEVVGRPTAQEAWQTALFVELSDGQRIGVGTGFDAATLQRLITVLREV